MRVGVVGIIWPDSFADNICNALSAMGHSVTALGTPHVSVGKNALDGLLSLAQRALPKIDRQVQRRLVRKAVASSCELIINLDARLEPDAVKALQAAGIRTCLWFPDAVVELGRFQSILAPYDALFYKEPMLVERLRTVLGLPVHYLPEACNPRWHNAPDGCEIEPHLAVVGQMYPSRVVLLRRLLSAGIPLRLYGPGFPRWVELPEVRAQHSGKFVRREEKARVFRSAAAVLNNLHPGEVSGMNARLFEATGSGAAVLTEWRAALPDLFEEGTEVVSFRSFDDLVDQARLLLGDPGRSRSLGDAAMRRAHRDHTYEKRLSRLIELTC